MNRRQYLIAAGAAAVVIIGIIVAFSSGRQHGATNQPSGQTSLNDHATDGSEVRLTIEGPVNADEVHRSVTISVSRDGRAVEFDKTYNDVPVVSANYNNNQAAFEDFMAALQRANFTKQKSGATQQSEVGRCSLGTRYVYELVTGDTVTLHLWSSTCQAADEPFAGNAQVVLALFQAQIPDYDKLHSASRK